jgi:hypothetical protein
MAKAVKRYVFNTNYAMCIGKANTKKCGAVTNLNFADSPTPNNASSSIYTGYMYKARGPFKV